MRQDEDNMRDEFRYLFRCSHGNLTQIKVKFIRKLLKVNSNFSLFDRSSIFHYIISMKDKTIQNVSCDFIHQIMSVYHDILVL